MKPFTFIIPLLFIAVSIFGCRQEQAGIKSLIGREITGPEALRAATLLFREPNTTPLKDIILRGAAASDSEINPAELTRLLGQEVSETEAIDALNRFALPDSGPVEFCCGNTACGCDGLADCIGLWISSKCADVPGPDIVNGACRKDSDTPCSNPNCQCPVS